MTPRRDPYMNIVDKTVQNTDEGFGNSHFKQLVF